MYHNVAWAEAYLGILIHPAVWPHQTLAENWGGAFLEEGLSPHLPQRGRDRGVPPYQVSS